LSNFDLLIENLANQKLSSFTGPAFRMHNPVWAWSPMSKQGAVITGGRFNPKGSPALYFGLSLKSCMAEISGGISTKLVDPQILCSYQVKIDGLIDLRTDDYYEIFSAPWRLLKLQKLEPPGWKLYKAATEFPNIKGFIVPSYQVKGESNLVLVHWKQEEVKIHDPDGRMKSVYGDRLTTN
jgi:RES domain-containing protein